MKTKTKICVDCKKEIESKVIEYIDSETFEVSNYSCEDCYAEHVLSCQSGVM